MISGNALLLGLGVGLRRWAQLRGLREGLNPGQVLGNAILTLMANTLISLVCLEDGRGASRLGIVLLFPGFPLVALLVGIWAWALNRLENPVALVAAVGTFVVLTFMTQVLIQFELVRSEAPALFVLSVPLAYFFPSI